MNTSINDLKTKGLVVLSYPADLRSAVLATIDSWKNFCALSAEVKKTLAYSSTGDGVGYELKDGGYKGDKKENIDVALVGKIWLQKHLQEIEDPVALEFVRKATKLVEILKPIVLDFAQQTQDAYGIRDLLNEVEQGEDVFFVRFIHYFGDREIGEETATAHVDRSGFTLHLFESAPGLQCMTYNGEWINMPVSDGETVIIPGMQMQLRSKSQLRALCHRVVSTPETAQVGRYSAVCFVQLKRTPKCDKDKHGRLQEKIPGFNYQLSHEDFVKFFK